MKRSFIRWVSFLVLTISILAASFHSGDPTHAQSGQPQINWDEWDVIPGRVLVKYQPAKGARLRTISSASGIVGLSLTPVEASVKQRYVLANGGTEAGFISILPDTFVGEFDPAQRDRILLTLAADPEIVYLEPERKRNNVAFWGIATPNDPRRSELWGMDRIGAPAAWARQPVARAAVRVAIMEQRFDNHHPDLANQNSVAINNTEPITYHSTHVAGIVAATGNNGRDVVGVANVELVSLTWGDTNTTFAQAVVWAVNNQVRVINMSFGHMGCSSGPACNSGTCNYAHPDSTEQQAITNAQGAIVFVAAAGNANCAQDADGDQVTPASYNGVIAVSAIDQNSNKATFSNFGSYVDLAAPGVNIVSTITGNTTGTDSGTSMASPHVAGSAAAILAIRPTYDIRSIDRLLRLTAEDIGPGGRDNDFGEGVVRVDKATAAIADVYAESSATCSGNGVLVSPYCSLPSAINAVPSGGSIGLVRDSVYSGVGTLSKPMTLIAVGGVVTLK